MRVPLRWDIFCRVVDNFGDAGVCWRLARQLALEHRMQARLWIDDLASLARLQPEVARVKAQTVGGVDIRLWDHDGPDDEPGEVVVEAFGCGLPDRYTAAMAQAAIPPLWIVLEYLSAEPWVREHHALASPPPRLDLRRYFFFPGFVEGTGGLLREQDLLARRDAFGARARGEFWSSLDYGPSTAGAITISLFAYESAPLAGLFRCWEEGAQPIVAVVPQGALAARALRYLGAASSERLVQRGALEARFVPFLPQARYDDLLWSCDINFVRGEDSFVRGQWAARPLVWHVYPQHGDAHARKLAAFLDLYCESLPLPACDAVGDLMRAWNRVDNGRVSVAAAWTAFAARLEVLRRHACSWQTRIASVGTLADNLASFCRDKLK